MILPQKELNLILKFSADSRHGKLDFSSPNSILIIAKRMSSVHRVEKAEKNEQKFKKIADLLSHKD